MKSSNTILIRTKWSPPRIDPRSLPRERLLELIEAGRERKLTLILGPAGSGKSTLAAQWRQRLIGAGLDVAWFNLGADDETLWAAYLVASLGAAGLAVGDDIIGLSERTDQRSLEVLLSLLVNALYEHPRSIYLFLEDLHFLCAAGIGDDPAPDRSGAGQFPSCDHHTPTSGAQSVGDRHQGAVDPD